MAALVQMKTVPLFTICLLVISTTGLPDQYQSMMVRDVQDRALRKFYHELYRKKKMEAKEVEEDNEGKKVTELNDKLESETIKKALEEKRTPHTIKFLKERPASRSLEKTEATLTNSNNEQNPTFVLSKLLFHMSQLP